MVYRDLLLAEETGGRLHIAHASTAGSIALVRSARARGARATVEVTPHHLALTEDACREYDTRTKMNPPLRTEADRQALIAGLADGTVDAIATDHAPHHEDEKNVEFARAPFGVIGLETAVSIVLDRLVGPGLIGLSRAVSSSRRVRPESSGCRAGARSRRRPTRCSTWAVGRGRSVASSQVAEHALRGLEAPGAPVVTIVGGEIVHDARCRRHWPPRRRTGLGDSG
jgi:dihydroorotase